MSTDETQSFSAVKEEPQPYDVPLFRVHARAKYKADLWRMRMYQVAYALVFMVTLTIAVIFIMLMKLLLTTY